MSEQIRQPEPIEPGKPTLPDRAITWMCDAWQKIKPGEFSTRENIVIDESSGEPQERVVEERDLEVVGEVLSLYENAKEKGDLISKEKNPLGDDVKEVVMLLFSDTHLPGGNLEEEVYEKNNPYVFLKKARALFLGLVNKRLRGEEGEKRSMDDLREDVRQEDGIDSFNAFLALRNAFTRNLLKDRGESEPDSKILVTHVGDNVGNEQKMGDVAYSAAHLEEMREEMGKVSQRDAVLTKAQGNHDTDLINYGLEHDAFDREIFGSQVFLQEVGDHMVILSINTNFYSTFWHEHLERRKSQGLDKREQAALEAIRKEMETQKQLVEEALASGKQIILVGHEKGYLEQAVGGFEDSNVVAVVSGHTEMHSYEEKTNKKGRKVHYLNTGADKKVDTEQGKKHVLSGFALKVEDRGENEEAIISVEEIVPNETDYQQAVFSMM